MNQEERNLESQDSADQEIPDRATADAAKWLSEQNAGFDTPTFWLIAGLLALHSAELQRRLDDAEERHTHDREIKRRLFADQQAAEAKAERYRLALERAGDALKEMCDWHGGTHESECPADDTCNCRYRPFNDRVNAAGRQVEQALSGEVKS